MNHGYYTTDHLKSLKSIKFLKIYKREEMYMYICWRMLNI